MPNNSADLDLLIRKSAEKFATKLREAARTARTEADVRAATDKLLGEIEGEAHISLDARHEFTVASGRIDSVYDRVIIEYKNPRSNADKIGDTLKAAGSKKLLAQIKSRFSDLNTN